MNPELHPPPSYEYKAHEPWFVAHVKDGVARAWTCWTLKEAVARFWAVDMEAEPDRRTVTDGHGVSILGLDCASGKVKMVATREAMDLTLRLAERGATYDGGLQVLAMADTLQTMNGNCA